MSSEHEPLEGVAVVGMSGRFPGAGDVDAFWRNLCDGVESIRFYSDEELLAAGVAPDVLADPSYVKANAPLDGVELFDAAFFGMNPAVAQITDPQQRLFLETAWHAVEHAGYDAERIKGDAGVFGGLSINTYLLENLATHRELLESHGLLQAAMASRGDHLATLTAYKLNLRGPAFTVQSTCSTSLSAVYLACQALLSCQLDMALAGGVSVRVPQTMGYLFQEGGVASPDGHCRPFDARARGTVFGSGVGAVVLKRLEDALADGDTIHAVIRGSAANNDGMSKMGYTAPSSEGQRRVISMAHAVAGVSPDTLGYVECHGTGTVLGDPIELEALTRAFSLKTSRKRFCAIGSVKGNIGHLDTAAGIAGLIKTVLCLKHRKLPTTLHFESANPQLDLATSPFHVNSTLRDWEAPRGHPRRAGVSSFGIGGTNVHMVLEEAPAIPARPSREGWHVLPLSARTPSALEARTEQLREHLAAHPELDVADVAFTLQVGRKAFEHRRVLICDSLPSATEVLERLPPERCFTARHTGEGSRAVAFVFPGAGRQQPGMGLELSAELPGFRQHLDECLRALDARLGLSLRSWLDPLKGQEILSREMLARTALAEPALFAVEYALARTWMGWGVRPQALLGEGVGEYVAACIAGVMSLEDAAAMVGTRSRLLQRLSEGILLVVMQDEATLAPLLAERGLSLAQVGRPSLCVVSGPRAAIKAFEAELLVRGVPCRRLLGDRALQSPVVDEVGAELEASLRSVSFRAPTLPLLSSVTGKWVEGNELASPRYWAEQLRRTLRLSEAWEELFREPQRLVLEVGPGRGLLNMARLHPARGPEHVVLGSLVREGACSEIRALVTTLGRLWLHGVEVDWARLQAGSPRRRIPLPQYPFERQRLWLEPRKQRGSEEALPPRKADVAGWFHVPSWRRTAPPVLPVGTGAAQTVLLFADRFGLGELLAARLTQRGHTVIAVSREAQGLAPGEGGYVVEPGRAGDYRRLLQGLEAEGRFPTRVLHLWGVDVHRAPGSRLEVLPAIETLGFKSLMYLAQALGAAKSATPLELLVLTSQLFQVIGDEVLCPEKATLLGPALVIGQEYPHVRTRVVDVALPTPGSLEEERLVSRLLSEVEGGGREPVVAWRGAHRWARSHEPVRLERPQGQPARLRPGGVYLVTGGLGGMGLVLAEELARTVRGARLVLLGRRPASAQALQRLRELEGLGAEVMVASADVSDRERMAEVLRQARARFGPVHGLIHAAGVPAGGALQLKTDELAERVLAPKVRGTLVLDELLAGEPLDFIVYCSSRTTVLGGFGQADYVAANAFLDAFAHARSQRSSIFTVSVDWCSWREVGMLANAAARQATSPTLESLASAGSPADGAEGVALDHPLVARRLASAPGREVYETVLRVETHWVLDDHRILGNPVIAGTTYLEMVRAALAPRMRGLELELSDIFFLMPLSVRAGEQRVARLELEESGEGFSFQVSSRAGEGERHPQTHVMGRARLVPAAPERRHDLGELASRCPRSRQFTDEDARDEDHGPRWQCVRQVRWGEREILATLELPGEFAADLEVMGLHPSMLDKAIGTGRDFILGAVPYMPYSYKRLVYRHPLPRRVFVHTRSHGEGSSRSETPSFDLVLMDEQGRELVEIHEFALKRVNDVGAVYKNKARHEVGARAQPEPEVPGGENVYQQLLRQEGISPREGVDVFHRVLASEGMPQLVVSTRDVEALLARGMVHTSLAKAEVVEELVAPPQRAMRARPELAAPYVAPETPLQEALAGIVCEALGLERIGLDDSFFELGADSVVAIQVVSRIKKQLGREVAVAQLFESPTLRALSGLLGEGWAPTRSEDLAGPLPEPVLESPDEHLERGARRRARLLARRHGGGS